MQDKIREVSDAFFNLQLIKGHLGSSLSLEEEFKGGSDKKLTMSSNA